MKRLCTTNVSERRSHRLSVRRISLRPMWKNQNEWLENVLENRQKTRQIILVKGCMISARKKPIHPSEKEISSKKIRQITAATKKPTSLLQLLSDGKFILLKKQNMYVKSGSFLCLIVDDDYVLKSVKNWSFRSGIHIASLRLH